MKLLVITQSVDIDDPVLGFFHGWIGALAPGFERIEVVCLRAGKHQLPPDVRVHSLGKERGAVSSMVYVFRFYWLLWKLRGSYDSVFVHMNQEYILLGGLVWKLSGKPIYMWRNHYSGNILTDVAALFCRNVFCTSRSSYTAKYKKTNFMPVGVDLAAFSPRPSSTRVPRSVLFLARMAPSKRPDMALDALRLLREKGVLVTASFYGTPLPQDEEYYRGLISQAQAQNLPVTFYSGVPNHETPAIYAAHEVFVNCSPSGMYDKTIFEAAAMGALPIAVSKDYAAQLPQLCSADSAEALSEVIEKTFGLSEAEREGLRGEVRRLAENNSLEALSAKLRSVLDC